MSPPTDLATMPRTVAQPKVYGSPTGVQPADDRASYVDQVPHEHRASPEFHAAREDHVPHQDYRPHDDHVRRLGAAANRDGGSYWSPPPAETDDRFSTEAEPREVEGRFGGAAEEIHRQAATWPPTAQPEARDGGPDIPGAAQHPWDRPDRATAFAQVPVPPASGPPGYDQQRGPGQHLPQPGGPSPDDQPPRQRWGGAADNPDQTLMGRWDGLDTGDARADAWPGAPAEVPHAGRATASGTAWVTGRDTEGRPPRQHPDPESDTHLALPWADRDDTQQDRFDNFRQGMAEMQPPPEPPPAQVRNMRVLAMVLAAAVLLLAIPLGTLWLLGRTGDPEFSPAVGSCVKQDGGGAAAADCGATGAYKVVAKANEPGKCDPRQPHIVLQNVEGDNVLCLRPAAAG
jgi:hypothetical protein